MATHIEDMHEYRPPRSRSGVAPYDQGAHGAPPRERSVVMGPPRVTAAGLGAAGPVQE